MIDAIKKRRSIRNYLEQGISDDQLKEILNAALFSPSANGLYPWELIVIKDKIALEMLSKLTPWSSHIKESAAAIIIVGHEEESPEWIEDCSIVAQHIWLEATNQGLASCWTQIRGKETAEKEVKKLLNIPQEMRVLCIMPLGVAAKAESEHTEEDIDKSKIKYDRY